MTVPDVVLCTLLLTLTLRSGHAQSLRTLPIPELQKEDKRGLSPSEERLILDVHNAIRRREPATNMKQMTWNSELAALAQNWSDACAWRHSTRAERTGVVSDFSFVGESLYASAAQVDVENLPELWAAERRHYQYNTGLCNKECWRYTQIVWAESYALGCGIRYCPAIENLSWEKHKGGYLVSCLYGPGGNIPGEKPYIKGDQACGSCPSQYPYCVDNMCSDKAPVTRLPPTDPPRTTTIKVTIGAASRPCSLIGGYLTVIYFVMHVYFMRVVL